MSPTQRRARYLSVLLALLAPGLARAAAKGGKPEKADWYLVSSGGKPAGFYSEAVRKNSGKALLVTAQKWVNLGAVPADSTIDTLSTDDEFVTPVSFDLFYSRRDGKREFKLSANRKRKGVLRQIELTLETIKPERSKKSKTFPYPVGSVFLSSLPRYLARHKPGMYVVTGILEDVRDLELVTKHLRITRTAESKSLGGRTCERSYVDYGGATADMWVAKDGTLCLSTIAESGTKVEPTTEEAVNKLDPPPFARRRK
jgi:hypothetical protein